MPELPEVETVRRGLEPLLGGRVITTVTLRRAGLRIPFPAALRPGLEGARVTGLRRRGKYLLADLDSGAIWLSHLGMSGCFHTVEASAPFDPAPHDHVILTLDQGTRLVFNDPRRFGFMDLIARGGEKSHPSLRLLGPEPLDASFDGPALRARLAGRKTSVKSALLDQRVVAGVGNIYACEALYRAGIDPRRPAGGLSPDQTDKLARALRLVLAEALASGGSTLRNHRQLDGSEGRFQHAFAVYGHAGGPCAACTCKGQSTVQIISQGGRTTFWCPVKQR